MSSLTPIQIAFLKFPLSNQDSNCNSFFSGIIKSYFLFVKSTQIRSFGIYFRLSNINFLLIKQLTILLSKNQLLLAVSSIDYSLAEFHILNILNESPSFCFLHTLYALDGPHRCSFQCQYHKLLLLQTPFKACPLKQARLF